MTRTALPVVQNCDACGACCTVVGIPPYLDEIDLIPRDLQAAWTLLRHEWDGRGQLEEPCPWFDPETRRCRQYEHRPNICRMFDVGDDECLHARKRAGIG